MNYFDIVFIILFLWSAYKGFTKGFIIQLASLAALILGVWGSIKFSGYTSALLQDKVDISPKLLEALALCITFFIIVIAVFFLGKILDKVVSVTLGIFNRLAGVLFALIKTAFIISILLLVFNTINEKTQMVSEEKMEESFLYKPLAGFAPLIFPYFKMHKEKKPEKGEEVVVDRNRCLKGHV